MPDMTEVQAQRRLEILTHMATRDRRTKNHVLLDQHNRPVSAIRGFVCIRCHLSTADIMDTRYGDRCQPVKARWAKAASQN